MKLSKVLKMNNEVRKGITNQEVNKSMLPFISVECLIISSLATYGGVIYFGFNGFATFIIAFLGFMILSFTPLYPVFGFLFSLGWAYIGYKLFYWLTTFTGGGNGIAITVGVIGFIIIFLLSLGARIAGKEYLEDIENK
jgi:hypothetical protein